MTKEVMDNGNKKLKTVEKIPSDRAIPWMSYLKIALYILPLLFILATLIILRYMYQHNLVNSKFTQFTNSAPIVTSKILGKQQIDLEGESLPYRSDGVSYGANVIVQGFVESRDGSILRVVKGDSEPINVKLPAQGSLKISCVEPIDCTCEACVLDDIVPGTLIEIFSTYDQITDESLFDQVPLRSNVKIR